MAIVPDVTSDIMKGIYTALIADDTATPSLAFGTDLQQLMGVTSGDFVNHIYSSYPPVSDKILPFISFHKTGTPTQFGVRDSETFKFIVTTRGIRSNLFNILSRVNLIITRTFAMPSGSLFTLQGRPYKVSETGEVFEESDGTFNAGSEITFDIFRTF